ncbi:MAG: O-antigen ligase family protein [Firmicutes bacterium]|nr:O-antigen ligase family protein [Bacillota bacterium]
MSSSVNKKNNTPRIIAHIEGFISGGRMIPVLAAFTVFCHMTGLDFAGFTVMWAVAAFVFCSRARIRGAVPPLFFALFCASNRIGVARPDAGLVPDVYVLHVGYLVFLAASLILFAAFGIWKRRKFLKFRLSLGLVSVFILAASVLLGGWFSPSYSPLNLAVGAVIAAYLVLLFLFFVFIAPDLSFQYLAMIFIGASMCILFELIYLFAGSIGALMAGDKPSVALGWGISNNIAPMLLLGMPFSAYYMAVSNEKRKTKNEKRRRIISGQALVSSTSSHPQLITRHSSLITKHTLQPVLAAGILIAQAVGITLCKCRGVVIFAVPFFILALVYALIRQKARARIGIACVVFAFVAALLILGFVYKEEFSVMLKYYLESGLEDNGRLVLFHDALDVFKKFPFFGAGAGYKWMDPSWDMPIYLVHNTVFQFMLWGGIFGFVAIAFHFGAFATLFRCNAAKNPSNKFLANMAAIRRAYERRVFVLSVALLLILNSMLDWMWLHPAGFAYYAAIFAWAERDLRMNNE